MTEEFQGWSKIAIVGRAGRFSAARDVAQFWTMIAAGRTATTRLSDEELLAAGVRRSRLADPNYVKAANILPDMQCFDAGFWGFSPREASILDPQHRHFLECAWEALEDTGHMPEHFQGRIGVFAGVGMQAYLTFNLLSNPDLVEQVGLFLLRHTGNDKDFLPTRLSYLLNLTGPSVAVQTACSTGLVAVHLAVSSLLAMECDMAIAGGVTIELPHGVGYRYAPGEVLSPDGYCRAFDNDSQGTVFGSGVGLVVLRRLQDALDDGDDIKAVILGSAINNDGASKVGYLAPSVDGQAAAAAEALTLAGVPAETVTYLEAHGTGTPIGDPIELAALTQVYGSGGRQFCGIGSVKSNIGHLDTAAGTASLIKVVEALRRGQIPPSLHYRTPNQRFDLPSSPFYVVDTLRAWPRGATPRRAGVNSLGVGGTNAHVVVEEAPPRASLAAPDVWRLLPFSARTALSLAGTRAKWQDFAATELPALADVAFTLRTGRRTFAERWVVAARTVADVQRALAGKAPQLVHEGRAGAQSPEIVFLFPGGGAQYPGAGADLMREMPAFAAAVDTCLRLLASEGPADLREMMFERPFDDPQAREKLGRSSYALPALFVLEYAYAKLWESWGIVPTAIVAHSIGEYAGAVVAGVLGLQDALRLVALRGAVVDAAPPGAVTTIPAGEAEVRALIGDALDIAACNAPEATVVSGTVEAIAALEARLKDTEHEAKRIRINAAAHSRLLDGQLERFRAAFAGVRFAEPKIPFVSSLRGDWGRDGDFMSADYWVRHLRHTVRFTQAVATVLARPDRLVLELGPGQSLGPLVGMAKAAHKPVAVVASARRPTDAASDTGVALTAFGALWAHGIAVDWSRLPGVAGRRVSLPTYAFAKDRHWVEPGTGSGAAASDEPARLVIERLADLSSWCETVEWSEAPLPPAGESAPGTWLVFGRDDAVARAVLAALAARGVEVAVASPGAAFRREGDHFVLRPDAVEDYEALFAALGRVPTRILHLWSLGGGDDQSLCFDAAFCLARALHALDADRPPRLLLVSAGATPSPATGVTDLAASTLFGIAAVAPREIPGLEAIVVDLDPNEAPSDAAQRLLAEATASRVSLPRVAWRDGRRLASVRTRLAASPPSSQATSQAAGLPKRLRKRGVYVITGGTGGIGRTLAIWLAQTAQARVALLARSATSDPALAMQLAAAGGEAMFVAVDVTDRTALAAALDSVRAKWGAVHGAFHAAGTVDDAPLAQKTLQAARRVMAPKIEGGRHLAALLPEGTLDLFCVFSSSSVVLAPPGQTDYVAANAWLEALASSRADGLAIAWGVWRDIGMAERTYGTGVEGTGSHPLLGPRSDGPNGEIDFTRRLDPAIDWVIAEHVVGGQPVLPGTAYVELAAAAAHAIAPGQAIQLQSFSLLQPMLFPEGLARLVTVSLRAIAGGYDLTVESRAGRGAVCTEHARARLAFGAAVLADLPASLVGSNGVALVRSQGPARPPQPDRVAFGPRWQSLGELRVGTRIAEGSFVLPGQFAADLDRYLAHPALLDMAATVGLHLLPNPGDRPVYAPISAERIRLFAPLPRDVESRATLVTDTPGRMVSFDVVLRDKAGRTVAIFERFSLRAVPDAGMGGAASDARLTDVLLARGIRAADAPALFARVLDLPARHLVVSSVSLDQVRLAMAEARPTTLSAATAAIHTDDPPRNAIETQLATIWCELLGVPTVGRSDDFFALGGHSLNAVRMLGRIRKQVGADLPLATLFESPTIAALAAHIFVQRPDLDTKAAEVVPRAGSLAAPLAAPLAVAVAAALGDAPDVRTIETTTGQREIFAAILIDAGVSRAYNLSISLHLRGPLDRAAVAVACTQLVARHDSLRSTFSADGMSLRIRRDVPFSLDSADLADLTDAERTERLAALHATLVEAPFDLAHGPMFRATLVRLAADRHELLFLVHHIVCDGWSIGVLMRDFHALYEAHRQGSPPSLPVAAGIGDFVAAEQAWLASAEAPKHREYWLQRFADGAPSMELPTDHARPPVKTTRATRHDDVLGRALQAEIRAAAKSIGASLPNFVFAAFHLYLGRVLGSGDIVVGLPASGQLAYDLDRVVGHCVNFLPIRSKLEPEATFADFVRDMRSALAAALDHQKFSYGALVRDLRLRRDPSRIALVPVIFNIDNLTDVNSLAFAGLGSTFTMNPRAHEHFELFVNLLDEPERVLLSWIHNADLFTPATIASHAARFQRLLRGLAQAPKTKLAATGRLLAGATPPASGSHDDPGAAGPQVVTEVFARVAARHPDRIAVRFGAMAMNYATLDARSDALAARLASQGVRSGDLVGISSARGLELLVAVLGALKAGAGYVPFDTTLPAERLAFMAQDTAVKVLLGDCPPVAATGVPTIAFADFPTQNAPAPTPTITGASIAYVMYTSGTTGRPKGVVLPHRSVIRMLVDTDWLRLGQQTVTLHSSAFAFDTSIIDIFAALLHGGTVVVPPDGALSLSQLASAITSHGVNTLWLTSGLFHAIADLRPEVFGAVDQVIVGGDIVSPVQVKRVMDACPRVTVINGYGPTESNVTNAHAITRADLDTGAALPIGRAIPGTQVYVVDEQLNAVDPGMQGELVIGGRGLALGYHNRPELTAEKFVTAPWDATLRLYRSGDLAMDPGDGVIRFFGRMDGQVKIRGFRVELGEVEAAIESHPGIRQAVVVTIVPDGQTDKVLAAYVVAEGHGPDRRTLDDWLKARLPDFARPLFYKTLSAIPLNANGKVDRKALPAVTVADAQAEHVALEGKTETRMATIWSTLLGLKTVGAEANFFELGGHSLLAVRLFDAIRQEFGVDLPISTLFQNPTVRTLAAKVTVTPAPTIGADDDWDTAVMIHPGPAGAASSDRPLFIVGGVGGNVNNLYDLGQVVGRHRPMVGFQTRGVLGHSPRTSIEAMATEHIRYMRQYQRTGPYVLAGYSGGALTAFEMATQLTARGEVVSELFIFDTFAPGFASDFQPRLRLGIGQRLRRELELLRAEGPGFFFERTSAWFRRKVLRGPVLRLTAWLRPTMYRLSQVEDSWRAAANAYSGSAYPSTVTLLQTKPRALSSRLAFQQDPTLGWSKLVGETRLKRTRVPGDHLGMIQGNNAEALVAVIEERLRTPAGR